LSSADSVVVHLNVHCVRADAGENPRLAGVGVFDDVGQRFGDNEVGGGLNLSGQARYIDDGFDRQRQISQ
jgi:hypothetical protein